jgi:hypothetical protein
LHDQPFKRNAGLPHGAWANLKRTSFGFITGKSWQQIWPVQGLGSFRVSASHLSYRTVNSSHVPDPVTHLSGDKLKEGKVQCDISG